MLHTRHVEPWDRLCDRLDRRGALAEWKTGNTSLVGVTGLDDLHRLTRRGADPRAADQVVAGLVRIAATDTDACLVVMHLLGDGLHALARRHRAVPGDTLAWLVIEMACQIGQFPSDRRTRAVAASLLLDTKRALHRELWPALTGPGRSVSEQSTDPFLLSRLVDTTVDAADDIELADLLGWACDRGIVTADDVELLMDLAVTKHARTGNRLTVARRRGISERTLRRHRDRALAALRAAANAYLAA